MKVIFLVTFLVLAIGCLLLFIFGERKTAEKIRTIMHIEWVACEELTILLTIGMIISLYAAIIYGSFYFFHALK